MKATTKEKKPSRRRAKAPRRPLSFEAMARAAVAKADLLPDVTQLLSRTEDKAMIEAYIDQHCADNVKRELRAAARAAGDNDQVNVNIVWIKQEIAFALGVEVGRRIAGGAR